MDNVAQEVSASLDALMALLTGGNRSDSHTFTQDSLSTRASSLPTVSSSSSSNNNASGFEIRRATRRLDSALRTLETTLEEQDEQQQEMVMVDPMLQSLLVEILTSLAQALEAQQPSLEWRSQDILELYQDLAVTTCRILVMNDSFVLHRPEQLDALVDRIALLLLGDDESQRMTHALISCVNSHLLHVEEATSNEQTTVLLFPLLKGLETIHLLKICIERCNQETNRRWNPSDGRFDVWSFCTFLLKHLATCRGDNDMHGWLQNRFMEDEQARERYASGPRVLLQDVNALLDTCRAFGVDLIEVSLEILDQASLETAVRDHAHVAIRHVSLVYTTIQALQQGLEIMLPFSILRSLFNAYASFVAILTHTNVQQEDSVANMIACDLLVDLANLVLENPSSRGGVCDSSMQTAVSITLFCALDSGGIKEDMMPILLYMRDQGKQQGLEERPTSNKRPRQDDQEHGDSASSSKTSPFTNALQAAVMASLVLPNSSMDTTQTRDSVARLVHSFPLQSVADPWHSLVARKVKDSFAINAWRSNDASHSSWGHRVLQNYVASHQKKEAHQAAESTAGQGNAKDDNN